jgi:hypothetical protein
MRRIIIEVGFEGPLELTPLERGLLYSSLWRWFETQCITPTRIQVKEDEETG